MKQVKDVMTADLAQIGKSDSLVAAAKKMAERDVGSLPVVEQGKIVGVVTDRDIVVRGLANGAGANGDVASIMSKNVVCIAHDQSIDAAAELMSDKQIRRLYVTKDGKLHGVVSLGDLALAAPAKESGDALKEISKD